jgi:predicted AlkP superfamily phosphohydrolase/phosphomutase
MKYYFFRDKDNESNLLDGKNYHAAGYVDKLYCELDKPNYSGKDLAVSFFEPFKGIIISAWRAVNEVELFEVAEWEYNQLVKSYDVIDKL